jgi:hypothetical protein
MPASAIDLSTDWKQAAVPSGAAAFFVLTTGSDRAKKHGCGYFIPEFPRHITSITATPVSGGLPRE